VKLVKMMVKKNKVFEVMPDFPERKSVLEKKVRQKMRSATDRDVFHGDASDEKKKKKEDDDEGDDEEEGDEEEGDGETGQDDGKEGTPSISLPTIKKPQSDSSGAGSSSNNGGPKVVDLMGLNDVVGMTNTPVKENSASIEGQSSNSLSGFFNDTNTAPALGLPDQAFSNVFGILRKEPQVGVLYDSKALQIGYKAQFENGYQCKMVLYYGNRLNGPITEVVAQLPETEALKIQAKPDQPFEVKAGVQVLHYFMWICRKPFTDIPSIGIKFKYNGQPQTLMLKMPLLLTSFCLPTQLAGPDCLSAWKTYGAEKECIAVRKFQTSPDVNELKTLITTNAHMSLVMDVEKVQDNFIASCNFQTATKGNDGNLVYIPILLRVETKPGANVIRISIRSGHKSVSEAVLFSVTTLFGAAE